MRAKEFTFNIPVSVKLGDFDIEPTVAPDSNSEPVPKLDPITVPVKQQSDQNLDSEGNPIMISPQQQEINLKKAEVGVMTNTDTGAVIPQEERPD